MKRTFTALALLFAAMFSQAAAQEGAGKFDPVFYASMFTMGEVYTDGRFLKAKNAEYSFENYMIDKADVIAFTLKQKATDTTGWTMWLDFAMNRVGQKCVTRVFAQKQAGADAREKFDALVAWMKQLWADRIGDEMENAPELKRWKFAGRGSYELTAKLTEKKPDGKRYLTFEIKQIGD